MKTWLSVCALTLGIVSLAQANPAAHPAARTPTQAELRNALAAMPNGDALRGKRLGQQLMCASCHGETGVAISRNWSSLAGQTAAYTYKSLQDYQQRGRFENQRARLMQVAVTGMSQQDMADVAVYYASLKPAPSSAPRLSSAAHARAEQLARHGDPARLITACASCHGAAGQGNKLTPALAGQTVEAFMRTMHDYRAGHRITDANQGMRQFAQRMTLAEINDLAIYYARMGKP